MSGKPAALTRLVVTDLVVPIAVYYLLRALGVDNVMALLVGGSLCGLSALLAAVRNRRLDAMAVVVLIFFALGLLALAVTGSARMVLAADSLPTAVAGGALLASLIFYDSFMFRLLLPVLAARQMDSEPMWRAAWENGPTFRHSIRVITAGWGVLLLGESLGRLALIAVLPLDVTVVVSKALQAVLVLSLIGFAGAYAKRTGLGMGAYLDSITPTADGPAPLEEAREQRLSEVTTDIGCNAKGQHPLAVGEW